MREIVIGGAQMGPIQKADTREEVVERMIALLQQAKGAGCDLVVFPELCLTTFFPRWYMENQAEVDQWFEREMPNAATAPLFAAAREAQIAISFGYAELTPEGRYFNTSILTDRDGNIVGKYRKTHLPGHSEFDHDRAFQHLEKRYFEPGDTGFQVWRNMDAIMGMCICNDRRWPETYRVMGLQGVELVMLGYNTPSVNSQDSVEGLEKRLYHSELSMTSAAYQNATWVVGVAKAGDEDGHPLMGGSMIVDPNGYVMARAETEGDELIVHACDMDACNFGKSTIFDFARHRRIEHYGLICSQTGVVLPD
ncbi:N-carbamoyl-D-amino-acid hydrolase [Roseovarius sp.]|uniref:N-carbamoyl-D-amino-acid hydrolase n=1 Tax=Roseovarius sp. TaxID=1486281 RepID=UPI000C4A6A82|nr:N-carbamoyl-D-amino-acid hydrolase [Roseovarius sp.]MAZ22966.1 N-carbamoyl-D-amino-acid hydrolase [Roseovarius sp.]|tara:strand:+ start:63 stop:989 length:927 start_codon:yes stop_codon:yes gene_type:complete